MFLTLPANGNRFDLIWARISRVTSFIGGMAIMAYETAWDKGDRPWLYAAAVGMMGLPVARAAEAVLSRIGSSGPQELPGERPESHPGEVHQ